MISLSLVAAVDTSERFRAQQLHTYSLPKSQTYNGFGMAFHTEAIQPTLPEHLLVYPLVEVEPGWLWWWWR